MIERIIKLLNKLSNTYYSIDALVPNQGYTLESMVEAGDYYLSQIGRYNTLDEAINALNEFMIDDKNNSTEADYDLRRHHNNDSEIVLSTINKIIGLGQ